MNPTPNAQGRRELMLRPHAMRSAIGYLRAARDLCVACQAPRAADKIRRALKSAEGAARHIDGLCIRAEMPRSPIRRSR